MGRRREDGPPTPAQLAYWERLKDVIPWNTGLKMPKREPTEAELRDYASRKGRSHTVPADFGARLSLIQAGKPKPKPENFPETMRKVRLAQNPNGEYLNPRNSIQNLEFISLVLQRDKYTCQHCGKTQADLDTLPRKKRGNTSSLHVHHIKDWENYPELRFEISNGLTLCASCHAREENKLSSVNEKRKKMA